MEVGNPDPGKSWG